MDTKIINDFTTDNIQWLGALLKQGDLVALPTETVYGLGANALDVEAIKKIYLAKGRPSDNPLILHIADKEDIYSLVETVPQIANQLMDKFWPGPLTIILPKKEIVPNEVTGGLPGVALRCPDNEFCRAIIRAAGVPVAAPSANISGRPSPTTAEGVYNDMQGKIAAIADDGSCKVGIESTVVEINDDTITILRPGAITLEMLKEVTSKVYLDKFLIEDNTTPKAPGMKYKHYAPDAKMITYVGSSADIAKQIRDNIQNLDIDSKIGLLISLKTKKILEKNLGNIHKNIYIITFDDYDSPKSLAKILYESLLKFNSLQVDYIWAEGLSSEGLGQAVMNRMDKASSHQIIKL